MQGLRMQAQTAGSGQMISTHFRHPDVVRTHRASAESSREAGDTGTPRTEALALLASSPWAPPHPSLPHSPPFWVPPARLCSSFLPCLNLHSPKSVPTPHPQGPG